MKFYLKDILNNLHKTSVGLFYYTSMVCKMVKNEASILIVYLLCVGYKFIFLLSGFSSH
jgi:hypothetical protein